MACVLLRFFPYQSCFRSLESRFGRVERRQLQLGLNNILRLLCMCVRVCVCACVRVEGEGGVTKGRRRKRRRGEEEKETLQYYVYLFEEVHEILKVTVWCEQECGW